MFAPVLRRLAPRAAAVLCLAAVVTLSLAASVRLLRAPPARRDPRPNILFILTDDQRWDALGCAGNRVLRTPNLDLLAGNGVRFRNAFVTSPICAASRASLLTGLYERTHQFNFSRPPLSEPYLSLCFPPRLRAAGYRTGWIGKVGVQWPAGTEARFFDSFTHLQRTPYFRPQPDGSRRHLTDIAGDRAVEFLRACPPDQRFCLTVSFNAPHAEEFRKDAYVWAPQEDGLYADDPIPTPRTMTPAFFAAQPAFLQRSESRVRFLRRFDPPQRYSHMVRGYYRMVSGIDRVVGDLVNVLQERNQLANTVIIFTSDNGSMLGERGFAGKWYGYESSLRVPLIVYDPRLDPGRRGAVAPELALNLDVPSTILDLAGLAQPPEMQGRSLVPILAGRAPRNWRTDFLWEHLLKDPRIPASEGVRTQRWTYIRWFQQRPVVEELYDHEADYDETQNLAMRPEAADQLGSLRRRTDQLIARYRPAAPAVTGE